MDSGPHRRRPRCARSGAHRAAAPALPTPTPLARVPWGRSRPRRWSAPGWIVGAAHARPRGPGLPRGPLRTVRASCCGTTAGTRVTTSPATASHGPRWRPGRACALSGALAVLASAFLFERLARSLYGARVAAPASLWFAVAAAGDAWIGRLTFALGVTFALAAALVLARGIGEAPSPRGRSRRRSAAISAATSPVAALLLVLALFSLALGQTLAAPRASGARACLSALARRLRPFAAVIAAALVVVLALQLLFPEGGFEPYAASSIAADARGDARVRARAAAAGDGAAGRGVRLRRREPPAPDPHADGQQHPALRHPARRAAPAVRARRARRPRLRAGSRAGRCCRRSRGWRCGWCGGRSCRRAG